MPPSRLLFFSTLRVVLHSRPSVILHPSPAGDLVSGFPNQARRLICMCVLPIPRLQHQSYVDVSEAELNLNLFFSDFIINFSHLHADPAFAYSALAHSAFAYCR
ncbi:hypothetical protein ACMFMF_000803 [Clarireedia jacksonii]